MLSAFDNAVDFIRFFDYNMLSVTECPRPRRFLWNTFPSKKSRRSGASPPAASRSSAKRGASPALLWSDAPGGYRRTPRNRRTRGSRAGSMLRKPHRTKIAIITIYEEGIGGYMDTYLTALKDIVIVLAPIIVAYISYKSNNVI